MGKTKISGVGCILLDYLYTHVSFNSETFKKYLSIKKGDGGFSPGKLVFTEDFHTFCGKKFLDVLEEIIGNRSPDKTNLGGPSIVSLIHAAQMLGEEAEVNFYGALGKDPAGEVIMDITRQTPVRMAQLIRSSQDSPFTYVLSDPEHNHGHGERTFINNIGAAWDMKPELLDHSFFHADMLAFGGTAIVPLIHQGLSGLLKKGKQHNCINIVNTVYDFISEKANPDKPWFLGDLKDGLQLIDLLIMDGEEALRISGQQTLQSAMNWYINSGVSSFVITNGPDPVWYFSDGRLFLKCGPGQLPVLTDIFDAARNNQGSAGDTTGCGDNFAGGVIAAFAEQFMERDTGACNLPSACEWGIVSGGYASTYIGGTYLEKHPGEKRMQMMPYYMAYRQQVDSRHPKIWQGE